MMALLFKAAAVKRIKKSSFAAYTLIEIIFALAILAILFALAIPLASKKISEPRQAGEQLASALQLARQYAIEHGTRTRLVFANEALCIASTNQLTNHYGLYEFYIPRSNSTNLSAGFVGQWIPLSIHSEWEKISENVENTFAKEACDENILRALYFNPPQCWNESGADFFATNYAGSPYPSNYWQTPYPTSYPLIEQTNADESVSKYFQTNAATNFYNLRGIEFDPQGKAVFRDGDHINIRIYDSKNTNNSHEIIVDKATGVIRMKSP